MTSRRMRVWTPWVALVLAISCTDGPLPRRAPERLPTPPPALARAFAFMDSALSPAERDSLRQWLPDSAINLHMSVGLWLRNEAGLWKGGPIADSLRAHGVRHPDDMSDVILRGYGLYLRGDSVNLDSLIRTSPRPPLPQKFELIPPPRRNTNENEDRPTLPDR